MDVRNCKKCGNLFDYTGNPLCPACEKIKKWVREERLSFTKDSGVSIECEKCGRPILTGRFCPGCKQSMANSLNNLYVTAAPQKDKKATSAKMRFLGN